MAKREQNSIFKEVAQMAGDVIFCYDIKTKKFMHYSDKTELMKYGSWLQNFDSVMVDSKMVFPEDAVTFCELMERVKKGDNGTMEGLFRVRFHASGEYRWHRFLARTNFEGGKPSEVIGRITDVHTYMLEHNRMAAQLAGKEKMEGFPDKDGFMDAIVRCVHMHKEDSKFGCIIFNVHGYDEVVAGMNAEKAGEFRVSILQKIKNTFPEDSLVGRVAAHYFSVFICGFDMSADLTELINKTRNGIAELGRKYGVSIETSVGVCLDSNKKGAKGTSGDAAIKDTLIEDTIFENAHTALKKADAKGKGSVVFYSDEKKKKHVTAVNHISEADEIIAEYALKMVDGKSVLENGEHFSSIFEKLAEKIGERYGFERIAVSLCKDGNYAEIVQWKSDSIKAIMDCSILHIQGAQANVEEKVTFWGPYVVNNVEAYPDDSWYGQMVRFTAVKSLLQGGFECENGLRGVVSLEYYTKPHAWTKDEIDILDRSKYVADFCAKYAV